LGVLVVRPIRIFQGRLEIRGPSVSWVVILKSVEGGSSSEVRLRRKEAGAVAAVTGRPRDDDVKPTAAPDVAINGKTSQEGEDRRPSQTPGVIQPPGLAAIGPEVQKFESAPQQPSPLAAPSSKGASLLDLQGLLSAKSVIVGRREGLPGQRKLILQDAFRGERLTWFRLLLEGGDEELVERVELDGRLIEAFSQAAEGRNLRIVVQVEGALVKKKNVLTLRLQGGPKYTFSGLGPDTLSNFLKSIF